MLDYCYSNTLIVDYFSQEKIAYILVLYVILH